VFSLSLSLSQFNCDFLLENRWILIWNFGFGLDCVHWILFGSGFGPGVDFGFGFGFEIGLVLWSWFPF
jgi:hypothetical protein